MFGRLLYHSLSVNIGSGRNTGLELEIFTKVGGAELTQPDSRDSGAPFASVARVLHLCDLPVAPRLPQVPPNASHAAYALNHSEPSVAMAH